MRAAESGSAPPSGDNPTLLVMANPALTDDGLVPNVNSANTRREGAARPRKAEALRQASLKLLGSEKYKHPYYRAGFILVGLE